MKKVQLDVLRGDELKALLEQTVSDGQIKTVPEMINFLSGVPDNMTLEEYIRSVAGSYGDIPENSVGSEQIRDKSIQAEDLSDEVQEKIQKTYVADEEALHMGFDVINNV